MMTEPSPKKVCIGLGIGRSIGIRSFFKPAVSSPLSGDSQQGLSVDVSEPSLDITASVITAATAPSSASAAPVQATVDIGVLLKVSLDEQFLCQNKLKLLVLS